MDRQLGWRADRQADWRNDPHDEAAKLHSFKYINCSKTLVVIEVFDKNEIVLSNNLNSIGNLNLFV